MGLIISHKRITQEMEIKVKETMHAKILQENPKGQKVN